MMFREDRAPCPEGDSYFVEFELADIIREQGKVILWSEVLERIRSDPWGSKYWHPLKESELFSGRVDSICTGRK